jgi:hypothetical protein
MERAEVEEIFGRWFDNLRHGGNPEAEYEDRHPDCVIEHGEVPQRR